MLRQSFERGYSFESQRMLTNSHFFIDSKSKDSFMLADKFFETKMKTILSHKKIKPQRPMTSVGVYNKEMPYSLINQSFILHPT